MKVCILSSVHIALDNRVFYREAHSLLSAGYDVTLIAVHPQDEIKDGIQIIGLPRVSRWQRPLLWRKIYRLARQSGADIFHFHDPELLPLGAWLKRRSGKPVIYDIHEAYPDFIELKDYLPTWFRQPLAAMFRIAEPKLASLQSGIIFADDATAVDFAQVDLPKVTLFNFPGQQFVRTAVATDNNYDNRPLHVLYLGGMERNRGVEFMVEAFSLLFSAIPTAKLWLVGHFMPPDLEHAVRQAVIRNGLEQAVIITGRVDFEQIGQYLRQARVGWVPWQAVAKNQKNIPTKLFEYMAYALPIVGSDLHSIRPFLKDGDNGYLVSSTNPADHAAAIINLLNNPQTAAAMGLRGQMRVHQQYNWAMMEERLLSFYDAML
jgi:glycosyltransferase involved in cell wall biosynthesis